MESRLAELELRYTEQQALLQDLSSVVYAQQKQLDVLAAELSVLRQRLEPEPGMVDADRQDRPPHY